MSFASNIAGLLRAPVGNNLENRPEDVENTKRNFAREGLYKRPVENGYIDQELNDTIHGFQRDHDLKIDGIMNPGGETEAMLIGKRLKLPQFETNRKAGYQQASALPLTALRLFGFGLGAAGAMEWWKNNSTDHRNDMVKGIERKQKGIDKNEEARCEEMFRQLTKICTNVKQKYGEEEAAICRKQAMEVYSACLAGKRTLPPFNY